MPFLSLQIFGGTTHRSFPTFYRIIPRIAVDCNKDAAIHESSAHPVGKSYASKVDDEKSAFESGTDSRQHRHKNSATSILAAFADKGG